VAAGSTLWNRPARYRRRRPLPAIIVIAVLCLAATVVWIKVLGSSSDSTSAVHCDKPTGTPVTVAGQPPTTLGQALESNALDRAVPLAPAQILVRVVNGSKQRGQAAETTELLRQLGFSQVAAAADDPLYTARDLNCRAQIRFGEQGAGAARTLTLIEPCAELIKDKREDASVDFAIGNEFDDLRPKPEGRRLLEQLTDFFLQNPEAQGGLQANPAAQPSLDQAQISAARKVKCS
jgi:hypothetical protein